MINQLDTEWWLRARGRRRLLTKDRAVIHIIIYSKFLNERIDWLGKRKKNLNLVLFFFNSCFIFLVINVGRFVVCGEDGCQYLQLNPLCQDLVNFHAEFVFVFGCLIFKLSGRNCFRGLLKNWHSGSHNHHCWCVSTDWSLLKQICEKQETGFL